VRSNGRRRAQAAEQSLSAPAPSKECGGGHLPRMNVQCVWMIWSRIIGWELKSDSGDDMRFKEQYLAWMGQARCEDGSDAVNSRGKYQTNVHESAEREEEGRSSNRPELRAVVLALQSAALSEEDVMLLCDNESIVRHQEMGRTFARQRGAKGGGAEGSRDQSCSSFLKIRCTPLPRWSTPSPLARRREKEGPGPSDGARLGICGIHTSYSYWVLRRVLHPLVKRVPATGLAAGDVLPCTLCFEPQYGSDTGNPLR
jgi:hypothetical protein